MREPNAFIEFRDLAQSLEKRGVSSAMVIDAMFRLWVRASVRYGGRDGVVITLREIAEEVEAYRGDVSEAFRDDTSEDLEMPPTAH
jgi:hypothetical protein